MDILTCSLTLSNFEAACVLYQQKTGVYPATLGVSHIYLTDAYKIITEMKLKMIVVPIPGFPEGDWFICGGDTTIYSEIE